MIPIKDMIERGLVHVVRRGVEEAEREGAGAIILDMDTPGGRLDATEEIIHIITGVKAHTYTFVNPNAISAGAITAMATDSIYMAPGGRIGDAMPIMMSPLPFGAPQQMPDDLKEKAVSPTVALIRSAAQRKGHDEKLAEAMVRAELEYKIGEKVICPAGHLLTLTAQDAAQMVGEGDERRPLLSSGTVADLQELLETIGRANDRLVVIEITSAERVARFIEGFPVSGILLALGLLCLYIEFKTPGFGIPGISGILLLAVWFWGHHVAGVAGIAEVLIFTVGVVCLVIEIFITPGFGVMGISGIGLTVAAILMAMVGHYPRVPWYTPQADEVMESLFNFSFALVLTFIGGFILTRFLPETSIFRRISLSTSVGSMEGHADSRGAHDLLGRKGTAATPLRPAGIGEFGDRRVNVVARGAFVDKDTPIVVAETHGNRIVVEPAKKD